MTIINYLEQNAIIHGNKVALVDKDYYLNATYSGCLLNKTTKGITNFTYRRTLTWNEFNAWSNRFANYLLSKGISRGDKVAILMMNSLEWLPLYFGILKIGALAVPLNFNYTSEEILYCLRFTGCCVLIFDHNCTEQIAYTHLMESTGIHLVYLGEDPLSFAEHYNKLSQNFSISKPHIVVSDNDYAAIYFTSGTTGLPKAILHTHRALVAAGVTEQCHHGQVSDDVFLCIPPLYHTGSKMHWFGSLISGGSAVILKNTSPRAILDTIASEKITIAWFLMVWSQDILDAIERGDIYIGEYDLTSWRLTHMGAQPIPPDLIHRWLKQFPMQSYDTNYGLSEAAGPGCVHLGMENAHKAGSIGKAGYAWEISIRNESGNPVPLGTVGELLVKGPGTMAGYYNNPDSTAATLKNDWLYTGDMAYEDNDGFIYLVDRKKDLIISGGENIYPVQIENFIRTYPLIKDVAVIGLSDYRLGEIVAAIIETKADAVCSKKDILEFCKGLPLYKRPRKIIFDTIPRNSTGKINKVCLREKYK